MVNRGRKPNRLDHTKAALTGRIKPEPELRPKGWQGHAELLPISTPHREPYGMLFAAGLPRTEEESLEHAPLRGLEANVHEQGHARWIVPRRAVDVRIRPRVFGSPCPGLVASIAAHIVHLAPAGNPAGLAEIKRGKGRISGLSRLGSASALSDDPTRITRMKQRRTNRDVAVQLMGVVLGGTLGQAIRRETLSYNHPGARVEPWPGASGWPLYSAEPRSRAASLRSGLFSVPGTGRTGVLGKLENLTDDQVRGILDDIAIEFQDFIGPAWVIQCVTGDRPERVVLVDSVDRPGHRVAGVDLGLRVPIVTHVRPLKIGRVHWPARSRHRRQEGSARHPGVWSGGWSYHSQERCRSAGWWWWDRIGGGVIISLDFMPGEDFAVSPV